MEILNSMDQLFEHVKEVEEDVIDLSKESLLKLSNFLEQNAIEIDDEVAESLQYQDIISQQLSATIEVMQSVRESISEFNNGDDIHILQSKLGIALERAKEKRQAFSGNVAHTSDDEAIEFF